MNFTAYSHSLALLGLEIDGFGAIHDKPARPKVCTRMRHTYRHTEKTAVLSGMFNEIFPTINFLAGYCSCGP
jgi:hypothetical protein